MKRFLLFAAATLLLASCNNSKLGPEYSTPAEITNISAPSEAFAGEQTTITATLTCKYGLYSAMIIYWVGEHGERKTAGVQTYDKTQVQSYYSASLPGQAAGSTVYFQIACYTPSGVFTITDEHSYEVVAAPQE